MTLKHTHFTLLYLRTLSYQVTDFYNMKKKQASIKKMVKAIFVSVLVFLSAASLCQKNDFRFKHLNVSNGLSNNNVESIIQDHEGFMWFGTSNGLNKYDGYNSRVYKHNPGVPSSLISSEIHTLYEDNEKNLWVGTLGGLCRYQKDKDDFVRYPEAGTHPITSIKQDNKKIYM